MTSSLVARPVEAAFPARLGGGFRWFIASAWGSNLADGIAIAVGPLLVASLTDDPLLIAAGALAPRAPWLLFGLHSGVLADRLDRRAVLVWMNLARAAVVATLAGLLAVDVMTVPLALLLLFAVGVIEVMVDTTAATVLPMLVPRADLGLGNARLLTGEFGLNQLGGPPIGAALFVAGRAVPFATEAVLFVLAAWCASRLHLVRTSTNGADADDAGHDGVFAQVREGVGWLWRHPPMRMLTIAILTFNVTFGAAFSLLVLLAIERLEIGEVGFGLLTTAVAVGGLIGTAGYGWVERHLDPATTLRYGLIIEALTHLALATITAPWAVMAVLVVFGAHAACWGTISSTIRHRAVPEQLQGRVASVYQMAVQGGIVVGGVIGGVLARVGSVTTPFWFAFAGTVAILAVIWRALADIAHLDEERTG